MSRELIIDQKHFNNEDLNFIKSKIASEDKNSKSFREDLDVYNLYKYGILIKIPSYFFQIERTFHVPQSLITIFYYTEKYFSWLRIIESGPIYLEFEYFGEPHTTKRSIYDYPN